MPTITAAGQRAAQRKISPRQWGRPFGRTPRETLIMYPPFPLWTATHFTVSPFIPDCTGNSTARLQSASNKLSSHPPSDIQVWTEGSVPSLFWSR